MASWDSPVVASPTTASYAAPIVDFSAIANLPKDYFAAKEMALKSREMQRLDDQATAYKNGPPTDNGGNPDYSSMATDMLKLGNYSQAAEFQKTGLELQRMRNGQTISNQYLGPAGPGASGQPASTPASSSPPPQRSTPGTAQNPTIREILQAQNIPNDQWDAAAASIARQIGVGENDRIDTTDARISGILGPAIGQLKRNGIGQVVQPVGPGPQAQTTPSQRISQGFSDAGIPAHGVPDGTQATPPAQVADTARSLGMAPQYAAAFQSRLDAMPAPQRKALLEQWATDPTVPQSLTAFAEKRLESIERGEEPTTEQKNYEYDARTGGGLTAREANVAGAKAGAEAPYKIAAQAIREGARPVAVKPGEVVTTGGQLDPALTGITNWAAQKMGVGNAGAPAAPLPPRGSPPPGALPSVPSPPVAPNISAAAGPDQPARSAFTPQLIRNPDGSVASNITPSTDTLQKTAAQNYEKAREAFSGAQEVQSQLTNMENGFRKLNASGWSSTGTGAEAKLQLAKAANSVWQTLGVKDQNLPFDPSTIGSWEALTKDTTRLGFALSRTLGAREAMQVVSQAINANPSIKNTPLGAKMVLNTIRQNAERQSDYFEYATRYAQTHGGDLLGAETSFAKLNPPTMYARRAIVQAQKDIPQEAVQQLRDDPKTAAAFDEHYGQKGLANMFLGNARLQGLQ